MTLPTSTPARRLLHLAVSAALLAGLSACASQPKQLGAAAPKPSEGGGEARKQEEELSYCEELFATLNELDASTQTPQAIAMAEAAGRDNAERCREVFREAASTPGSALIADVFADLILIRAFELGLDRRAMEQETTGVCPETRDALARIDAVREAATKALTSGMTLKEHERGVLAQVATGMGEKQSALEPFYLRGCKTGSFDPKLFVSTADLQVGATMTPDQCRDMLVAMAAFDMEQAPRAELDGLIDKLKRAASPCRAALIEPGPIDDLAGLEALNQMDLLESSPVMIEISLALGRNEVPAACEQMRVYIGQVEARQETLTGIIQDARTPQAVQEEAKVDLALLVDTLRDFSREYTNLCAL